MRFVVENLQGSRGGDVLFSGLSFTLEQGHGLQVMGPNGAGKSTLLRIMAGLIVPDGGTLRLEGIEGEPADHIAYLGHLNAMKPAMTVRENLEFWARFHGGTADDVDEAVERLDLGRLADLPFSYLSAGQKRRTALARLLAAPRPLWLIDEPTAALDTANTALFAAIMEDHLAEGGMIIAATHLPLGVSGWSVLEIPGRAR